MLITTIIPTYCRPHDLARCLMALERQLRPADEVLVIVRDSDVATWEFLASFDFTLLPIKAITVSVPGQVAALNSALDAATGEIIAITDDDAAPHPDWLQRIESHFLEDTTLGGLGGRDWRYDGTNLLNEQEKEQVGVLQWVGRTIGNHHVGTGKPRQVDILKGANMSYRRAAVAGLRFDDRLLGSGAQVHNDMAFSLAVKRRGWKLLYDPAVSVNHYEGPRLDEDRVGNFISTRSSVFNSGYNEALILVEHLPKVRCLAYILWSFLIGTRQAPGLVQALRFTPRFGATAWQRFLTTQQAKFAALMSQLNLQKKDVRFNDALSS